MDIIDELKTFIVPHPYLHPEAGEIFTPKENRRIRFYFSGGFIVDGDGPGFEINFNVEHLLILASSESVHRFLRSSLVGFEIIYEKNRIMEIKDIKGLH